MKEIIGRLDRFFRMGLGLLEIGYSYYSSSILFLLLGSMIFLSGLIKWCPLYNLMGMNTTCEIDGVPKKNSTLEGIFLSLMIHFCIIIIYLVVKLVQM